MILGVFVFPAPIARALSASGAMDLPASAAHLRFWALAGCLTSFVAIAVARKARNILRKPGGKYYVTDFLRSGRWVRWALALVLLILLLAAEPLVSWQFPEVRGGGAQAAVDALRLGVLLCGGGLLAISVASGLRLRYPSGRWRMTRKGYLVCASAAVLAALIVAFVFPVQIVTFQMPGVTGSVRESAVANFRQSVLWCAGGVIALVTLYLTFTRQELDRDSNRTDRFTAAIDHIGDLASVATRIGGIHALGRLAADSTRDRDTVALVLASFIKHQSDNLAVAAPGSGSPLPVDIRVALQVVSELTTYSGPYIEGIDFSNRDMTGIEVSHLRLMYPVLTGARLHRARIGESHLLSANIAGADFSDVTWDSAHMSYAEAASANFKDSQLQGAYFLCSKFENANFEGANLAGAILQEADFRGANLRETILDEADLSGTNLSGTVGWEHSQLESAGYWDHATQWPEGYQPPWPTKSHPDCMA
ncbi:pentapeptide repeat-containing protein [Cryobacterium tagatosivorans]|uniref:pentapeptide repeat-containing protein n=1 Tax=Cryobacterium tagatosivorans TaxID=1259199 RepID=UPI00141B44DD|nr:pentapeptide repeat-containing protein [Cryobacterium tagatosivorans]